jgi:hypothetical protein
VLEFESEVTAVAFDASASCLFIATEGRALYASVNGDILSALSVGSEKVISVKCITIAIGETRRVAICGTATGKVFLASPRFDWATIETRELASLHSRAIREFIVDPRVKSFVSIDDGGTAFLWTAMGITTGGLNRALLPECPNCGARTAALCMNCSRAFCAACMDDGSHGCLCLVCNAVLSSLCER